MIIKILAASGGGYFLLKRKKPTLIDELVPKSSKRKSQPLVRKCGKLVKDLVSAISGEEREQQQQLLDGGQNLVAQKFKRDNKRNIILSCGAMGLASLGAFLPALKLLGGAAVIWMMYPIFKLGFDGLKNRRATTFLVDSVFIMGLLFMGNILLAALITLLSNLSIRLISSTEMRSREQLTDIFAGHRLTVWVLIDGVEIELPFKQIKAGDSVIVNAGEIIPVDGHIQEGFASIDQHMLTGESQPAEKTVGEPVFASTLLLSGRINVLVETAGSDSVAAQIGKILNNTGNYTDSLTSRGQKIADDFVVPSLLLGAVALALRGTAAAVAVLYVPLGADMRATGPLTVLNFLQILSRKGILIKDGRVLESLQKVDTVVFDKTGTLTQEQPTVGNIYAYNGLDENTLLWYAATAEYRQPHPIAKAIVAKAKERQLDLPTLDDASYEVGYGIKVRVNGQCIQVGSHRFMERDNIVLPPKVRAIRDNAETYGYSLIYVAVDGLLNGVIELQPTIRPETLEVIQRLHESGKQLYIISGDHEQPTRYLAEKLHIDRYFAGTLPEHKAELVQKMLDEGRFVCFVGDGINDSIALKTAQVSVSLRGASSAATDTAQVILMNGSLVALPELFSVVNEFEQVMHKNFIIAIAPGVLAISGVFLMHFNLVINIWLRYIGLIGSLVNTMLPFLKYQQPETEDGGQTPASHPIRLPKV